MGEINNGDYVRDKITGYAGIVVAKTKWLWGCDRVLIQSQELKDGKPIEGVWLDVYQVESVNRRVFKSDLQDNETTKTGGPQNDPSTRRQGEII